MIDRASSQIGRLVRLRSFEMGVGMKWDDDNNGYSMGLALGYGLICTLAMVFLEEDKSLRVKIKARE